MKFRLAVRAGRLHALSRDERARPFPGRFRAAAAAPGRRRIGDRHVARSRKSISARRPRSRREHGHARPSTASRSRVPEGTSVMRAAMEPGVKIPKLCATDMLEAFGSCRLCLVEIEGRRGTPASCTTPAEAGMVVRTQTERLAQAAQGRDGALHLRPSAGLPDLRGQRRLRIAGHGRRGRPARRALRLRGRQPSRRRQGRIEPLFHLRPVEMHRLLALRARLRGSAGHLRADHRRAAASTPRVARHGRAVPRLGMRVLRRLRAGLPDRDPDREKSVIEIGQPEHSVVTTCAYCGVGCAFKAEMRGEEVVRMVPYKDGKANRRPFLRQGPFRLGLCHPQGPHPQADDPRQDHRSLARSVAGTRRSPMRARNSSASRPNTAASSIGGITSSRCTNEETFLVQKLIRAGFGNNNVDTCARVCHSPTGYGLSTTFGTSAGTQDFNSVEQSRRDPAHRRQPDRRPSGVRLADEEAAARRAPS